MTEKDRLVEPRWPVALAVFVVYLLLMSLRSRVRVFPGWVSHLALFVTISPLVALSVAEQKRVWLRAERVIFAVFFATYGSGTLIELVVLIHTMLDRTSEVTGLQLLTSSIAVWGTNVVMFSLLYWRIDRGGPEARMNCVQLSPDFFFPAQDLPAQFALPNWIPKYIDYLFIAFTTATAFSPTEAMPISRRAKLLMMSEGLVSLITILAVAARAINILGR